MSTSTAPPAEREVTVAPTSTWVGALALNAVLVVAFVVIGRTSHDEGSYLAGTASTAWPFLASLALGWMAVRGWRRPRALWPTGVLVLAVTVVGAMALRTWLGAGAPLSFVVVTTVVLGLFLLGWRGLAVLVARRR